MTALVEEIMIGAIPEIGSCETATNTRGEIGYFDEKTGVIVIYDPKNIKDNGTVFRPDDTDPRDYWDKFKKR